MPSYQHLAYRRNAIAAARKQSLKPLKNQDELDRARSDFAFFCEEGKEVLRKILQPIREDPKFFLD